MAITIPPRLYKYQPYNMQALDNLKERHIWFSKPARFNDPFDCSIKFSVPEITAQDLKEAFDKIQKEAVQSNKQLDADYLTDGKPNEYFKNQIIDGAHISYRKQIEAYRQRGIACFSEKVDDILMWGHYSDGHRGFCLEFDTNFSLFQKAFKVIYSDSYPSLNPIDFIIGRQASIPVTLLTTKSTHWCYQNEWRVIREHGDLEDSLEPATLTGVYFGSEMPFAHKEITAMILAKHPTHLYEMRRSNSEFKLEIEDYIMPLSAM